MGQSAIGIMLGCECPKGMDMYGEDGDEPDYVGVMGRWEKSKAGKRGMKVRVEGEGGKRIVGVWIAVGGSGEDDAPYLGEEVIAITDIKRHYKGQIRKALARWDQFVAHALSAESYALPHAKLWLVPCEVA